MCEVQMDPLLKSAIDCKMDRSDRGHYILKYHLFESDKVVVLFPKQISKFSMYVTVKDVTFFYLPPRYNLL